MVHGRQQLARALLDYRDGAVRLLGRELIAVCKFHQMLHALDIAELFGTWANVSADVKEAAHKANKQVRIHDVVSSVLFFRHGVC